MPWTWHPDTQTVSIRFRLTPKASRDKIGTRTETAAGPCISAYVRAIPENGAANRALIVLTAKWLGIPKSTIELTTGAKSRIKTLRLNSADPTLIARLERLFDTPT